MHVVGCEWFPFIRVLCEVQSSNFCMDGNFLIEFIPFSLLKENLAKLHKGTINYILGKKLIAAGKD